MKKIILILVLTASFAACKTNDKKTAPALSPEEINKITNDTTSFTTIEWLDKSPLDLGKTKAGAIVEVAFRFKNSGSKPLVISSVTAQCGCTVPESPKEPFAPGEEGVIKATFNSKGYSGLASKHITVVANTDPTSTHDLTFNVQVTE